MATFQPIVDIGFGAAVRRGAKRSCAHSLPFVPPADAAQTAATPSQPRLCVLVDGESFNPADIEAVLCEAGKRGVVVTTKLFASTDAMSKWERVAAAHIIEPVHIWASRSPDHARVEAIAIEAMHQLYRGNYDGLCLVTSDLDIARTIKELRESRLLVYGFGYAHTSPAMRAAYDDFVEVALAHDSMPGLATPHLQTLAPAQGEHSPRSGEQHPRPAVQQLQQDLEDAQQAQGWGGQVSEATPLVGAAAQPMHVDVQVETAEQAVNGVLHAAEGFQQAQDRSPQTPDVSKQMSEAERLEMAKAVIAEYTADGAAALSLVGLRLRGRSKRKNVLRCLREMHFKLEQRKGDYFIVGHEDGTDMQTWRRPATPNMLVL